MKASRRASFAVVLAVLVGCGAAAPDASDPGSPAAPGAGAQDGAPAAAPRPGPSDAGSLDSTAIAASAALKQRISDLVDSHVDPSGTQGKTVGLAVAVLSPTVRDVLGFGTTKSGQAAAPTADSIFEIGSVTKVFTGLLLARSVEHGEHQLTDAIGGYFPGGTPEYKGQHPSITLLDLATHTGGLPDMPSNLHGRPPNPATGYGATDLATFMATSSLAAPPGQTYAYSNVGAGIVGYLLGLPSRAGSSEYGGALQRELTSPLGMVDTTLSLSAGQEARRAQGYVNGQPAPVNDIGPALVGSGGLRSTGADMLRFLAPALGSGPAEAVATWKAVLEPQRPIPNGHIGLFINRNETSSPVVFAKSGGTAGFTSQIVFTTSPPAAVVLLANTSKVEKMYELATAILKELP